LALENLEDCDDPLLELIGTLRKPAQRVPVLSEGLNADLESLLEELRSLKESCWKSELAQRYEILSVLFADLAQKFCGAWLQRKIRTAQLTIQDLESLTAVMVREHPELAARFAEEWDYWMIDEYQDTSPQQVQILRALVGEGKTFIVGDPQQSIYLFRGARSEVFAEQEASLKAQGQETEYLLTNYRSDPRLLHFFNSYFAKLSPQFVGMNPKAEFGERAIGDPGESDSEVDAFVGSATHLLADALVMQVIRLINRGVAPSEICILARAHRNLAEFQPRLAAAGVAVQLHASLGFYDRREVQDALGLLRFLINPYDDENLVLLLRSPWLYLSDSDIVKIADESALSLWEKGLSLTLGDQPEHPFQILAQALERSRILGLSYVWEELIVRLGLIDFCHQSDPSGRREANLWKLILMFRRESRVAGFVAIEFARKMEELITLEGEAEASPVIEPNRVQMMTVHASKGLQFEHVMVLGMDDRPQAPSLGLFVLDEENARWTLKAPDEEGKFHPHFLTQLVQERMAQRESEESDRVLYVAFTRAKKKLHLFWNEDAKPRSWAANWPYACEAGDVDDGPARIRISRGPWELPTVVANAEVSVRIREPYTTLLEGEIAKQSVTSLLQSTGGPRSPFVKAEVLAKAQMGIEIHRWLELLKYQDPQKLEAYIHAQTDSLEENVSVLESLQFVRGLTEVPLQSLVRNGHVEWGFCCEIEEGPVEGQIDLWGVDDNGETWIIDYKSGSSKNQAKAHEQLELYARALHRMGKVPSARAKVAAVYVLEKKVSIREVDLS
jgi:ATP-dependent helicase/nuclease subunit A